MEDVLELSDQASDLLNWIVQDLQAHKTNWTLVLANIQRFIFEPTLLDSKLKEIMEIMESGIYTLDSYKEDLCDIFYSLCKIRGYKAILKYCTPKIENLIKLSDTKPSDNWKVNYTMLMLLSVQILMPFPLDTINSQLKENVYSLAHEALKANGKEKEAGSVLMSRLLSRNDMNVFLDDFISQYDKSFNEGSLIVFNELLRSKNITIENFMLQYQPTTMLEYRYWFKCLGKLSLLTQSQNSLTKITKLLLFNAKSREPQLRSTIAKQLRKIIKQLESESQMFLLRILLEDYEDELTPWEFIHTALLTIGYLALDVPIDQIIIDRLVKVLPRTLFFKKKVLSRTLGSDIRDASCFVAWAISKRHMSYPLWGEMYKPLVLVALLDSDLSVRKAALAALQEFTGRHPVWTSEYKIQLLESVDSGMECVLNFEHALIPAATMWCWANVDHCGDVLRAIYKIDKGDILNCVEKLEGYRRTYLLGHLLDLGLGYWPAVELKWSNFEEARAILHYLTALGKVGQQVDAGLGFAIIAEYELRGEFERFMKYVEPSEQLSELCMRHLDNRIVCECIGANNSIITGMQPQVHAFVTRLDPTTQSSELKRALLYSVRGHCDIYVSTIVHCLDDYTKTEQGDVGSWVRYAAVDILRHEVQRFDAAILRRLLRLSGEPNVKVRMASIGILKSINCDIPLLQSITPSETISLAAPASGTVLLSTINTNSGHQWLQTTDALSFFQLICLYLQVYYKSDTLAAAVWEGLERSLRTRATKEHVICALIEASTTDPSAFSHIHLHASPFVLKLVKQIL